MLNARLLNVGALNASAGGGATHLVAASIAAQVSAAGAPPALDKNLVGLAACSAAAQAAASALKPLGGAAAASSIGAGLAAQIQALSGAAQAAISVQGLAVALRDLNNFASFPANPAATASGGLAVAKTVAAVASVSGQPAAAASLTKELGGAAAPAACFPI